MDMFKISKYANAYISASFIYILANGLGQGTTLLSNIFFTRYMSQTDYGLYSNYYSYVALLVPFVGMNLYFGLTNAYIDYKKEIHKLRSSVLLLSIVGFFVTLIVMLSLKAVVGISLPYICIVLAIAHAYGFFAVNYYIQSMNMENRFISKGLMLAAPNILQALVAALFVLYCSNYISRAIGSTLGVCFCGIVGIILILKAAVPSINFEYWKYILKISLPAILGSVAAMVMQQCDKVMITSLIGAEETAVYALVYNIGYILYAVEQATGGVWQVWLYNTLHNKFYGNIPRVQKWYMFFMVMLATVLYMVSPEIIKILSPENYWCFEYIIPFVLGAYMMLVYSMEISIIQYRKKTYVTSAIVVLAAFTNIVLNYIGIPLYGGIGAAYASVLCYLLIFVLAGTYLHYIGESYLCGKYLFGYIVFVLVLGVLFSFVQEIGWMRYIGFGIVIISEMLYIVCKKDELEALFAKY